MFKDRATISFHLTQEEKEIIIQKALSEFNTLSEYLRYQLLTAEVDNKNMIEKLKSDLKAAESEKNKLRNNLRRLERKVRFYECDKLKDFYKKAQGEHVSFITPFGKKIDLTIESIEDMYSVMINSFKND